MGFSLGKVVKEKYTWVKSQINLDFMNSDLVIPDSNYDAIIGIDLENNLISYSKFNNDKDNKIILAQGEIE
jgi:hypothetical protein